MRTSTASTSGTTRTRSQRPGHPPWARSCTAPSVGPRAGRVKVCSRSRRNGSMLMARHSCVRTRASCSAPVRTCDRVATLTTLGRAVTFTDAKDAMLGLRVARALEQPATTAEIYTDASGHATSVPALNNADVTGHYRNSEGLEGDAVWGMRARWCMLSGTVEGAPVTIAILDHPTNVGFPTYWHARGYGLFAANPLGRKVFSHGKEQVNLRLEPGEAKTFRYRVLILSGPTTSEQIEQYYQDFAR